MSVQLGFVLRYETLVVIRCHCLFLVLVELQVNGLEREASLDTVLSQLRLVVELSHEDHRETEVLVFVVTH